MIPGSDNARPATARAFARVLFPVDFSPRSRDAAATVRSLALRYSSHVTLLHALAVPRYEIPGLRRLNDLSAGRERTAGVELDAFAAQHLPGVDHRRVVVAGDPASVIVDYARRERIDLIAMPTAGLGTFRQFLLGSTTAKVLHDAECPVLTGVHHETPPRRAATVFRHIVCAVDLKPQSARVLEWAAMLAASCDARLCVIHALQPEPESGRSPAGSWNQERLRTAQAELAILCSTAGDDLQAQARPGSVEEVVVGFAREQEADLVVIGRGVTGGLFGRLRSNAYDLIRESPCPVASV